MTIQIKERVKCECKKCGALYEFPVCYCRNCEAKGNDLKYFKNADLRNLI